MKKITFILALMLFAVSAMSQITTYQIAKGAVGVDSLTGTAAGATVGTKYYYFNTTCTATSGLTANSTPITQSEIYAVQFCLYAPRKTADMMDSTQVTLEISYDNTNWIKWTAAGKTTDATQTNYRQLPRVFGTTGLVAHGTTTGETYLYGNDLVVVKNETGGATYLLNGCVAPYFRVKTISYDDGKGAFYPEIFVALKKL